MTYQEFYENLYTELSELEAEFLNLDAEVSKVNGFGDVAVMDAYLKVKRQWQVAHNNFFNFLALVRKKEIDPNAQVEL